LIGAYKLENSLNPVCHMDIKKGRLFQDGLFNHS